MDAESFNVGTECCRGHSHRLFVYWSLILKCQKKEEWLQFIPSLWSLDKWMYSRMFTTHHATTYWYRAEPRINTKPNSYKWDCWSWFIHTDTTGRRKTCLHFLSGLLALRIAGVKYFLSSFAFHIFVIGEIDIRERGCFPSGVKYFSTQYTQPLGLNFVFVLVPG